MNSSKTIRLLIAATLVLGAAVLESAPLPPTLPPSPATATAPVAPFVSPVQFFRDLLAMTPAEQESTLAPRTPRTRKALLNKVREYQALDPETRELRLRTTELRWYLKTLLPMEPARRSQALAAMPARDRASVAHRLAQWDRLSPGWRNEILKHERTMDWLRKQELESANRPGSREMEIRLTQWQTLSREKRVGMIDSFKKFFLLSKAEQEKTLAALPQSQRATIAPAIRRIEALPQAQRVECVNAFRQIASMPAERRQSFVRKASQWRQMTANERQTWTDLVVKFPPLPPGFSGPPSPEGLTGIEYPPLPPGLDLPTMPPLPLLTRN